MFAIVKTFAKALLVAGAASTLFVGCGRSVSPHSYQQFPDHYEMEDFESTPRSVRPEGFLGFGGEETPAWVKHPQRAKSARYPYVAFGEANFPKASDRFNRKSAIHQARLELVSQLEAKYAAKFEGQDNTIGGTREKERIMGVVDGVVRESHVIATYEVADSKQVYVLVGVDSRLVDSLDEYADEFPDAISTQRPPSHAGQEPPAMAQADDFFNTPPGE